MTEGAPPPSLPRRVAGRLGGLLCLSFLRLGNFVEISFLTLVAFLAILPSAAYLLIARVRLCIDRRRFLRLAKRARHGSLPSDWRGEGGGNFSEHEEWWDPTPRLSDEPPPLGVGRLLFSINLYPRLSMLYRHPLRHDVHEILGPLVQYPQYADGQLWLRRLGDDFARLADETTVGNPEVREHSLRQHAKLSALIDALQRPKG